MSTESVLFSPAALPPHPANRLAVFIDIENFAGYCADMGVPVDIAPVLVPVHPPAIPIGQVQAAG